MEENIEVKPCPFCRGKASHSVGSKEHKMNDIVMCLECDATMESDHTPYSSLKQWNTRADDIISEDKLNLKNVTYKQLFQFFKDKPGRLEDHISVEIDDEFFEVEIKEFENDDILDKGHVFLKIMRY